MKRARHKRERIAEIVDSCECDAKGMETCQHFRDCADEAARLTRKHTRRLKRTLDDLDPPGFLRAACEKKIPSIAERLAANSRKRQAACTLGKHCRCENNREFWQCARRKDAGPIVRQFGLHAPIDDLLKSHVVLGDSHVAAKGPDFTAILADAFKKGKGAVVVFNGDMVHGSVHEADALAAGTRVHKALEKALRIVPNVSIYDLLTGYVNARMRGERRKIMCAPRMEGEKISPAKRRAQFSKAFKATAR